MSLKERLQMLYKPYQTETIWTVCPACRGSKHEDYAAVACETCQGRGSIQIRVRIVQV